MAALGQDLLIPTLQKNFAYAVHQAPMTQQAKTPNMDAPCGHHLSQLCWYWADDPGMASAAAAKQAFCRTVFERLRNK